MKGCLIVGVIVLAVVGYYVRNKYHKLQNAAANGMRLETHDGKTRFTRPPFGTTNDSRIKCILCAGSGRSNTFGGMHGVKSQTCGTCRGAGWVDNPAYVSMKDAQKSKKR